MIRSLKQFAKVNPYILSAVILVTAVAMSAVILRARAAAVVGDINGDGTVNVFDLSILLSDWGSNTTAADLNHDGTVNIFDLSSLLSHWGETGSTPTPTPTPTPSPTPTPTATPPPQPVGDPLGRAWTNVLDDEFNGTSIDTSKWVALNGWHNNNVTSNSKNCTESGGNLILALPGDGTGCDFYSSKTYGAGANAHDLLVGDYIEARMWYPGPGTSPTSTLYNWPAFWAYDGSGNWAAGENDIAEALNHMEYNYHSDSLSSDPSLSPAGNWGNSWHVYGIYRTATQVKVYYDGVLKGTETVNDNGGPEAIMFTSGKTDTCCGAPTQYGSAGNVLVDWVRDWH